MRNYDTVYVKCTLSKGGFPTERLYVVSLVDDLTKVSGLVPSHYCFDLLMKPHSKKQEPAAGRAVKGYLEALLIQHNADGTVQLDLPDGTALNVPVALLKDEGPSVPLKR